MSQNIIIHRTSDPFARIPKAVLDDDRLSWKAKGVLCYLLSKPSGWRLRVSDLENKSKDGNRAVKSALKELRALGYASLERIKDSRGRIAEWRWKISDLPEFHPEVRFAPVENAPVENSPLSKTECTKTEHSKIDQTEETKETPPSVAYPFSPKWIPTQRSKEHQLGMKSEPSDFPTEDQFADFLAREGLEKIETYRPDLYAELCRSKWHKWDQGRERWERIKDWRKYLLSFEQYLEAGFPQ